MLKVENHGCLSILFNEAFSCEIRPMWFELMLNTSNHST